jgi:hypothetical protein
MTSDLRHAVFLGYLDLGTMDVLQVRSDDARSVLLNISQNANARNCIFRRGHSSTMGMLDGYERANNNTVFL